MALAILLGTPSVENFHVWVVEVLREPGGTVMYLSPADKSHRLTRRLSQEQKGLNERALMASQRLSDPW
jgi:hypothetical protein